MARLRICLVSVGRYTYSNPVLTPPVGLLSIAAYIRQRFNADFRIIDQRLANDSNDNVLRQIVEFAPDIVGFRVLTLTAYLLGPLTHSVRQALPGALLVMGGPHVSAFGEEALGANDADLAVVGEGELSFEQILNAYLDNKDYGKIPGLVIRNDDGSVTTNPGAFPHMEDLDNLPFPAYDLIDLPKYWRFRSFTQVPPRPYVPIMSSRGCPYDCIYCHRIFGKRFRAFSAERIVSEIEHWHQTYQLKDIEFIDDIFNLNPRRVLDFSELMQRRSERFRLAFPNALRCDILTRETVDALVAAGTYYSSCAIDTASPRLQTFIGKHLNIPRCLDAIKMLAERKVLTHGYSMIGFPTETEEEIELTIDTVCGSELHTASFFIAIPYPKTRMYELAAQMYPEKLAALNHCDADFRSAEANFSAVPDDAFFRYQRQAWRRFYLNPSRIFRILRAYPNPFYIATYMPLLLLGIGKGFFRLKQIM